MPAPNSSVSKSFDHREIVLTRLGHRQDRGDGVVDDRVDPAVVQLEQQLGQALVGADVVALLARPLLVGLAQRHADLHVAELADAR